MLAGVFPLIADAMYRRLTFQGASSLLGGIVSSDADAQNDALWLTLGAELSFDNCAVGTSVFRS
jgi:hypothetical protein